MLQEVSVNALKISTDLNRFPAAYSQKAIPINWPGPSLSLQEYLVAVPGQLSFNQSNYAQDLRISIRGFGARSAFGIRGIKLVVDGIPETTPDGQGQLDNLPLPILSKIELIRGSSALRYGNAAGGVLSFSTLNGFKEKINQLQLRIGSYGQQQINLINTFGNKKLHAFLLVNHQKVEGYRSNSELENNQLNLKINYHINSFSKLNIQLNATNSPLANDAGGLTLNEYKDSPRDARERNRDFNTGEKIKQTKAGLAYKYAKNAIQISAYSFLSNRTFEGKLPFEYGGWVNLNRNYGGFGGLLTFTYGQNALKMTTQVGLDNNYQNDRRKRFYNRSGIKGDLTFDQNENFMSLGAYAIQNIEIYNWTFNGGLRWDSNRLEAIDNRDPTKTHKKLNAWSPQLGISYRLSPHFSFFGNLAKSYETPTLSELSANPSGESGFNNLSIQEANNKEIGVVFNKKNTASTLVLFAVSTKNDLVPYELEEFQGRTFYRNAGQTLRKGVEWAISHQFKIPLNIELSLNYTDFSYRDFEKNGTNLNGKKLPGIPPFFGGITAHYSFKNKWRLDYSRNLRGSLFPDDNNTVKVDAFAIDNLFLTLPIHLKEMKKIRLNLGLTNLFNVAYSDNIRINAFGGRYYEPGNARAFYSSLQIHF